MYLCTDRNKCLFLSDIQIVPCLTILLMAGFSELFGNDNPEIYDGFIAVSTQY